jgi:hypothetical protein
MAPPAPPPAQLEQPVATGAAHALMGEELTMAGLEQHSGPRQPASEQLNSPAATRSFRDISGSFSSWLDHIRTAQTIYVPGQTDPVRRQ